MWISRHTLNYMQARHTADRRLTQCTILQNFKLRPMRQICEGLCKLVLMYRTIHNLVDIPCSAYYHPAVMSTRGQTIRYLLPFCRTDTDRHSFIPSSIRLWNGLPEIIARSPTLDSFKAGLGSLHQTHYNVLSTFIPARFCASQSLCTQSPVRLCSREGPALAQKEEEGYFFYVFQVRLSPDN